MSDLAVNSGLPESTIDKIIKTFELFTDIEKVLLYGSRAKGNYRAGSDIDLTIVGEGVSQKKLFEIENKLEGLHLPYKIDLSVMADIGNNDLLDHIKRVGVVFFSR